MHIPPLLIRMKPKPSLQCRYQVSRIAYGLSGA